MSFLNPVNEPVLRFSSTDADAPQINYAARTAGDVKAVLKACLVTGYGTKASAGWSVITDDGGIGVFATDAPSMSDYRIAIVDGATSSTWYYLSGGVRVNPSFNSPTKIFTGCDKTHASNGWDLVCSKRGVYFCEHVYHSVTKKLSSRITFIGQVKTFNPTTNMAYFCIGHNATTSQVMDFYKTAVHYDIGETSLTPIDISPIAIAAQTSNINVSMPNADLNVVSAIHIIQSKIKFVGQHVGIFAYITPNSNKYGVEVLDVGGVALLKMCAGDGGGYHNLRDSAFAIKLDSWGY